MNTIDMNCRELAKLKEKYESAKELGVKDFMFQGKLILTDYAKYMIQYIESLIKEE